jgi:hypothetical protein
MMRKDVLIGDSRWAVREVLNQQSSYPRLLYKYRHATTQHLEPLLLSSTFYLSSREQFNDPFDAQCIARVSPDLRDRKRRLEQLKASVRGSRDGQSISMGVKHRNELYRDMLTPDRAQARAQRSFDINANAFGIYSMAETPRSLLMWAHYANNHSGVCLAFYVPADPDVFMRAFPVEYGDDYPSMEWTDFERVDAIRALLKKSTEWAYEQESRILLPNAARTVLPFDQAALAGIIFGARCSEESKAMVKELIDRRAGVGGTRPQMFNAHLAREKYSIGIFPYGKKPPADWKGRSPSGRRSKRTRVPPRLETVQRSR